MGAPVRCHPLIQGGLPCIAGTRVPTRTIWSFWHAGYTIGAIAAEYPWLARKQIWDAIHFEHSRITGDAAMVRQCRKPPRVKHK